MNETIQNQGTSLSADYSVKAEKSNGVCTIFLSGSIDSSNAPKVEEEIDAAIGEEAENYSLIIDLENCQYISSAGLRFILRLRKAHNDLKIINASTEVYEIFDITGFVEMMSISRAYRKMSVDNCEVIGQGANGKIYRTDPDTVVKVYLNPDSLDDIMHEREMAKKALVLGIPTAISYDIVRVGENYASCFEMLNAKSFSKLLASNPDNMDTYAKMYIDLLHLIHSTEVPAGQMPDQRVKTIEWVEFLKDYLDEPIYTKLHNMILAIPASNTMIHGDYHTKNIMLQNDEVILIDMDTLAVGHPVLELGSMFNAYVGFYIQEGANSLDFLGYDLTLAHKFWKKSLQLYYKTEDQDFLDKKEKQASLIGYVRLYRRSLRRNESKDLIQKYHDEVVRLTQELDSVID